jgi:hypothetical protein
MALWGLKHVVVTQCSLSGVNNKCVHRSVFMWNMRCVVCTSRHERRSAPQFHEFHTTRAHWVRDMKLQVYTARYHAKRWRMIPGFLYSPWRESVPRQCAQGGRKHSTVGLFSRIWANENLSRKHWTIYWVNLMPSWNSDEEQNCKDHGRESNSVSFNKSLDALPQLANREPCGDSITQHAMKT